MVGKAAAPGEKKRGRPRKNCDGRSPLAVPPAPAAGRGQGAAAPLLPARRSDRPRRAPRMDDYADYRDYEEDFYWEQLSTEVDADKKEAEDDDEESEVGAERGRREKKFRLLQKLAHRHHGARPSSSSSSSEDDGAGGRGPLKEGRSCGTGRGDDCEDGGDLRRDGSGNGSEGEEGQGRHTALECDQSAAGNAMGVFPVSTPLPDKKMLEAILDKLQKKDIYGVYAEPVDPEELPDYHDIINHPMDFATIRKKLATGVYCHLEQFESDVFLVCTNAMQYNAPDTIYFRQARSIQDLATKKFQKIRFDNQHGLRSEQKTRSNSLTRKLRKRSSGKSAHTPGGSDISLPVTCISTEDASSAGHKAEQTYPSGQPASVNGVKDGSLTCENKSDNGNEHSAKSAPVKLEKKLDVLYEDRRTTYDMSNEQPMIQPDPLFTTFEDEQKNLVSVGLDTEYSYARSLARFAGTLGPIAWKIASEKIEKALPEGTKFGPGWVGEYEPLPMPVLSFKSQSVDRTNFLCKIDYQERRNEDEMQSAARKGLQTAAAVPLDSSAMRMSQMTSGKANHSGLPVLFGFNKGFQSTIMNTTLLQGKPLDMVSGRDYKAKVGTGVLSFKSDSVVDMPVQRYEHCSKVTACRVPEMISGSRSNTESEVCKRPEVVSCQSESIRDLSGGKDLGNIGCSSGFMPLHQARAVGNFLNHSGKEQANGDPTQLVSLQGRKLVNDNAKQLMSTVPSPRGNHIAAALPRTPVWIPVARSSKQNVPHASDNFKRQAGGVSLENFSSESVNVSGFHENNRKKLAPSVHQLPIQEAGVECWVQGNGLPVFPQVITSEESRYCGQTPYQGVAVAPQVQKPKKDMCSPDLNITFRAPKSPVLQSSGTLVDSQQPDLALQL